MKKEEKSVKELVKPTRKLADKELDKKYEALSECGCHLTRCDNRGGSDEDNDDILF